MEQWLITVTNDYGIFIYLVILGWTFLEGETIVLIASALISGGNVHLNIWMVALFAFLGSFGGDQTWFLIGRKYGTPLLQRWPGMTGKAAWAFRLLDRHQNLFILSFRFIYGLRTISPFVIGMTGVARARFFALNLISAAVWANTFAWGGYTLGRALDIYLGNSSRVVLGLLVVAAIIAWLSNRVRSA